MKFLLIILLGLLTGCASQPRWITATRDFTAKLPRVDYEKYRAGIDEQRMVWKSSPTSITATIRPNAPYGDTWTDGKGNYFKPSGSGFVDQRGNCYQRNGNVYTLIK